MWWLLAFSQDLPGQESAVNCNMAASARPEKVGRLCDWAASGMGSTGSSCGSASKRAQAVWLQQNTGINFGILDALGWRKSSD